MTLDEDAAKFCIGNAFADACREHDEWIKHKSNLESLPRYAMLRQCGSPPLEEFLAAFGHRCAEAMREECAKVADAHAKTQGVNVVLYIAQAIRRVEIGGK